MATASDDCIGDRIDQARVDAGLSIEQLATAAGVSERALGGWIRSEHIPRRINVGRLERALHTTLIPVDPAADMTPRPPSLEMAIERLNAARRELDYAREVIRQLAESDPTPS